jgi:hypothetical protein
MAAVHPGGVILSRKSRESESQRQQKTREVMGSMFLAGVIRWHRHDPFK